MNRFTSIMILYFIAVSLTLHSQSHSIDYFDYTVKSTDLIFEGKVIESTGYVANNKRYVYTLHKVAVSKVFKGEQVESTINIITIGGQANGIHQTWEHTPTCREGDEALFFCKVDTDPEIMDTPFTIPFGLGGIIQYSKDLNRYVAKDGFGSFYDNIYNDLYLRLEKEYGFRAVSLQPNSIEQHFIDKFSNINGVFRSTSTTISVEFDFDNFSITGIEELDFDVMAKSNTNGLKLGEAKVLIDYSIPAFGDSIVKNENIVVSPETILETPDITPTYKDYDSNTLEINIPSGCSNTATVVTLATLTTSFQKFVHAKVNIENLFEAASLEMDDFNMSGSIKYYDDDTEECIAVDTIIGPGEVNPFLVPTITDYFPNPITAGTDDTLSIVGIGFGPAGGNVRFSNANDGGNTLMTVPDADIISWTDTLIKVRVPSNDSNADTNPAGSGTIQVETAGTMTHDTTGLEISYAVRNFRTFSTGQTFRMNLSDDPIGDGNENGILRFRIKGNVIDSSAMALGIIETAMCDWTQETDIQWDLGLVIPDTVSNPDSINIITFSSSGALLGSATAITITTTRNCKDIANDDVFHNSEFNILIRADVSTAPVPGTGWYFSTAGLPAVGQMDFYSVILHELGHAHNLKHAIDDTKIMYFQLLPSNTRRAININDRNGGVDILVEAGNSLGNGNCPDAVSQGAACLTFVNNIEHPIENITLYPNPATNDINLELKDHEGGETSIFLINAIGQIMLSEQLGNLPPGDHALNIDVNILTPGLYYVYIQKGASRHNIGKLIKH